MINRFIQCINRQVGLILFNPLKFPWTMKIKALSEENNWTIVGISGVTNSGKTTLCERLQKSLGGIVINQDVYFREEDDPKHIWVDIGEGRQHQNWESLNCINWDQMCTDLETIISKPSTDEQRFVFLDGHIIYNYKSLAETIHKKFFIDLDKKTVSERRVTRNYVPPDPPNYFDLFVWPLYLENRKQLQDFQITYIDGAQTKEEIFQTVYDQLKQL